MGWGALMCADSTMPTVNGEGSMFAAGSRKDYDYDRMKTYCKERYGLEPDFDFALAEFGGYDPENDFKDYSNIVFVNGDLDPWLPGCL